MGLREEEEDGRKRELLALKDLRESLGAEFGFIFKDKDRVLFWREK